ncbi:MAG: superoxide dismutase family protein [Flavobacteriaceae bacterium]|nr:superoxide dismutase family protein [Bacteroidia bacterium]MBT8288460.1 superoxide dismutase family protein [Bacteroidia bacterium]NNF75878.1 superoxide dismutase family protein [Flavobacteriaceae bacterium]NNK72040.1 superoxide dismutase family protein [Flavobacteriaceae bacterium]
MKKLLSISMVVFLITTISCKKDKKESDSTEDVQIETITETDQNTETTSTEEKKILVSLESKSGSNASGNVIIKEKNGVVNMVAVVGGLSEGVHAIHLHEKADCSSDDGTSTGGHWNPTAQPHGKWGAAEGYHKGDIGNFTADANGNGTITFITSEWCVGCGDPAKDILGKAIIVHQGEDDFKTQPTGAAGGRISCGGIIE